MSRKSATDIMDAAIEGAERSVAAAWQIASGQDGVRTPAYVNALQADPSLRTRMDDVLRPFVREIADRLNDQDWDCQESSRYFGRFGQEMVGYDDKPYGEFLRHKVTEAIQDGTPEEILTAAQRLKDHTDKTKEGNA